MQKYYQEKVVPALKEEFGYTNNLSVPKITKCVINIGTSAGLKDPKFNEIVESNLRRITGQKPVKTLAKKSISNFKIRQGLVVGMMVTLRGKRMYDFLDKLINVTFPRVRDFRGIEEKLIDKNGNLNIGFKEHISFPEIKSDEVEKIHGLQITFTTTAKNREKGLSLFKLIGIPFRK